MRLPSALRWTLLLVFIAVPIINFLPIGDDRFEDDVSTLVDPAGFAFSIWGLIFLGMLVFSWLLFSGKELDSQGLRQAATGLIVAGLASIHFVPISIAGNQVWVFVDVAAHLLALIYAYLGLRAHDRAFPHRSASIGIWWFAPSMYMGWISAATVVAFTLALKQLGLEVSIPTGIWIAAALILVLIAIGRYFLVMADAVYSLTVAWALVGIGFEQGAIPLLRYAAWAGAIVLSTSVLLRLSRGSKSLFYPMPARSEP